MSGLAAGSNAMRTNILVTGFTGRLGHLVAESLRAEYGLKPRVLVRQARLDAPDWVPPVGMEVAAGEYDDPESLDRALDGIEAVFLVSPVHPEMRKRERAMAQSAARKQCPPHIVKISGLGTQLDSLIDSGRWHAEIERNIVQLDLTATFLRPMYFMQNLGFQARSMREGGVLRGAVQRARIAMVDVRDIADVAAAVLRGGTVIEGRAVSLTGAQAYTYTQVAEAASTAFGRDVTYVEQTPDETRQALLEMGQPEWHIDIMQQFNEAFVRGWGSTVTETVSQVLNRAPRNLADYLKEMAAGERARGGNPFPS